VRRARHRLASRNTKKRVELSRILEPVVPAVRVLGLADVDHYAEPVETEPTFEGNALLKARAAVAATGLPSLADDSGICVDALNGMPGVLSARWSGNAARPDKDAANNALLLAQLSDVPDDRRGAEFRCAIAFVLPGGEEHVETGVMRGRVLRTTSGDGGFGYDPLFAADGLRGVNRRSLGRLTRTRSPPRQRRCGDGPLWPRSGRSVGTMAPRL
jgi:XTP/dITP diphosphohydrolase